MSKVFIEETSLSAIGDAIRAKTGKSDLLSPAQMVTAIGSISGGGSGGDIEIEPVVLTGDCTSACYGQLAGLALEHFGDSISTENVSNATTMFRKNPASNIPFDINFQTSSNGVAMNQMFMDSGFTTLPALNNCKPASLNKVFGNSLIQSIPDSYANWDFSRVQTYTYADCGYMFNGCKHLRYIPQAFLKQLWGISNNASYIFYNHMFDGCNSLDEIRGLGVQQAKLSSNMFSSAFNYCYRLKSVVFDVNEDGTPKTAEWKKQSIDLSSNVGYENLTYSFYEPNRNYNIPIDKWIHDEESYQALKNDPDSFVGSYNKDGELYSRYNKVSAIETINSLPDCSAYCGTDVNTIKFKGISGTNTDGGAINTLTEEEIAVAAAKGWTVTFV